MVALPGRHYLWLCAVFIAGGQISSSAQPFLVAERLPGIPADSALVSLGWNPSPDTNATGYFLCWGLASDACTNRLDVGNSTNTSVSGLATGMAYYFSVVAYGAAGQEAPPSNEISFDTHIDNTPPVIQTLPQAGGTLTLTWSAMPWQKYQVQYTTNLNQTNWEILANAITTTNALATASDATGPDTQRFYRVLIVP